jgi:hypothetical protein
MEHDPKGSGNIKPMVLSICFEHEKSATGESKTGDPVKPEERNDLQSMEVDEEKAAIEQITSEKKEIIPWWCDISLAKLLESATNMLRNPQNNDNNNNGNGALQTIPKLQALELIKTVLLTSLSSSKAYDQSVMRDALTKALEVNFNLNATNDISMFI